MDAWPESLVATHSGLRGRPGVDLTDEVAGLAVRRLAALLERDGLPRSVGIARDGRAGGGGLAAAAVEAALACGLDAVDFGCAATPAAKHAARRRGLGAVVVVTGSHLEPDWNGLKLAAAPGLAPLDVRTLPPPLARGRSRGRLRRDEGAVPEHVAAVCASVDARAIRAAGLRAAWRGGVGDAPALLLDRLGCLAAGVQADVSLVLDPDGDRLALADDRGTALDSEAVLPLVAIAREARVVVKGADTSRAVDGVVIPRGGAVHTVAPGELHLIEGLAATGGDLAGEGNGGVVVPAVGAARDGLAAAAAVLALLAAAGRPLAALAAELPRSSIRRSTLPCSTLEEAFDALGRVAERLGVPAPGDPEDGLRVERGEAWGLVRRSATEPLLRITVEAPARPAADGLFDELRGCLAAAVPA